LVIYKTAKTSALSNASATTIWTPPSSGAYSKDIWAPELHYLQGKWYVYFAADSNGINSTHRIYALENSAADPTNGTWAFKGKVFFTYSASGYWTDDYALGMLTLKDGGDPLNTNDWTKSPSPVFTKNTSGGAFGPGHNSFFKSIDGKEDWILYHANPQSGQGC